MAYKINGTTVVDNSRNVCACCVTSCCITASSRMDAPSGTTAQRPGSPATGSIYFDTDEGSLISYNGTEWSAVGGGSSATPQCNAVTTTCDTWSVGTVAFFDNCRGVCQSARECYALCQQGLIVGRYSWVGGCMNNSTYSQAYLCPQQLCCATKREVFVRPNGNTYGTCDCKVGREFNYHICCQLGATYYADGSTSWIDGYASSFRACYTKFFINKFGGVSTQQDTRDCICNCCQVMMVPTTGRFGSNSFYSTYGMANPTPNFYKGVQHTQGFVCDCNCHSRIFCCPLVHLIKGDFDGSDVYETCCYAYVRYGYDTVTCQGKKVLAPLSMGSNDRICCISVSSPTGCTLTQVNFHCTAGCGGIWSSSLRIIPKNPNVDFNIECWYDQCFQATNTGICAMGSNFPYCCSFIYMRNLRCSDGSSHCCQWSCYWAGGSRVRDWLSADGCKWYHMYWQPNPYCYFNTAPFFSKSTSPDDGNCCCVSFCQAFSPALEIIDLVNGCVECSIYYCGWEDCTNGSAWYPSWLGSATNRGGCMGYEVTSTCQYNMGTGTTPKGTPREKWLADMGKGSVVKSMTCDSIFYILGSCAYGQASVGVFDTSTLNFRGHLHIKCHLFTGCGEKYLSCLCYWLGGNCLTNSGCCTCTYLKSAAFCTEIGQDNECCIWATFTGNKNNTACTKASLATTSQCNTCNPCTIYINPCTNHLVAFYEFYRCCSCECRSVVWAGAICYDLLNCFCITSVETLWPNEHDKCKFGLCRGLCCWCSIHYCDRKTTGSVPYVYGSNMSNHYCCFGGFHKFWFNSYGTYCTDEAGIVFSWHGQPESNIESSCRFCGSCPSPCGNYCCGSYLGWYGPCCYGGCVGCNTACGSGCSNGLTNTCISFSLTKIPFSKKLCDSGFFDGPSSTMKYLIEALNFCDGNGLACALSCCVTSEMTCNRQEAACYQVSPAFNCKVDITSQYTAGTAAQYTWGKCFCSATRWFIGDTDCVTVRFCNCNTLCGGEITWQCLHLCYESCFGCSCTCPGFINNKNYIRSSPLMMKNITNDNFFDGNTNHAVASFGYGKNYCVRIPLDRTIDSRCRNGCATNDHYNGWVHGPTTGMRGAPGMIHCWFNNNYACICD